MDASSWYRASTTALMCASAGSLIAWVVWLNLRVGHVSKWTDWEQPFREMVTQHEISWKMAFVAWCMPVGVATQLFVIGLISWMQKKQADVMVGDEAQRQATIISQVKQLGLAL